MTDVPPPPPPPGGGRPTPQPPPPPPGPSSSSQPPPPPGFSGVPLTRSAPDRVGGVNKGLMIGIVAVIVAVLGLGVFLVFRDDDDGDRITGPVDTTGTSTAATTATTTDTEGSIAPPGEIPEPTEEPDGLGDEPAYDAAAQDCYDGSMQACDDLYRDADLGSDYERYGDTCAGRQEPRTGRLCVDAFPD